MTSHFDPASETAHRQADWERAAPYIDWLDAADELEDLWASATARAVVSEDLVARAEAVPGEWKLIVLSEDWCLDATSTIPPVAALAAAASNLDLRVLDRDDNLELMDEHLTNGTARSIPIVIVLDGGGVERAWWGPRPADLQAWFYGDGQEMEKEDRYRELRKWYARDRGQTTVREIVELLEEVSGAGGVA
ncbi:thioredoxin family protein [Rubrivirga marina]|uniref:Thioredoxin family protein n=1 Tax=Rubrivirga marina TaxID=1196024 RepID=A0A271IYG8_9BACT|nr:thioredoxin family protein [Rubrivirga marina]PAP76301.1 hypothetical protein BSZ37_07490 [Rubrivirga marina]